LPFRAAADREFIVVVTGGSGSMNSGKKPSNGLAECGEA